ncbi:MAG: hypothetical protein AAI978_00380 [Candidatus Hodgkinia cicadicola]
MYTKLENTVIDQNSTSCATVVNLIVQSSLRTSKLWHKVNLILGRRAYYYRFTLSLGNSLLVLIKRLKPDLGNITTAANWLANSSNGCHGFKVVVLDSIVPKRQVVKSISCDCKHVLSLYKRNIVKIANASASASAQTLITNTVLKKWILGKKSKVTAYWSKTLLSIAMNSTLLSALAAPQFSLTLLNTTQTLIINSKRVQLTTRNLVTITTYKHKLLKLTACGAANAFVASHNHKVNSFKIKPQAWASISACKLLISNSVLVAKFEPNCIVMLRKPNMC